MLLTSLSFDAPYFLYLFPLLVGILIYIYIKFYSNKKIVFPSFFLLTTNKEKIKEGKRIRLPKRFFYELLILLIFSLLLARITPINKNNNYLFFIDNSFSTKTKVSRFKTSFNNIIENALENLRLLPNKSNIKIRTSDGFDSQKFLSKSEAKNVLLELENSYSSDLFKKITFNSKEYKNTFLFTDRNIISKNENVKVFYLPLSPSICNFSILNLTIDDNMLNVTLHSFCHKEGKLNLALSCGEHKEPTKYINIMPNESIVENMKLPKEIQHKNTYSLCKVSFSAKGDALKEDNEAFFIYNSAMKDVYLVSDKQVNLDSFIPLPFNIKNISYSDIESVKKDDIIIFNNFSLTKLPKNPSIIMEPKNGGIFYKSKLDGNILVTSFKTDSPLISYINPMNLNFNSVVTLKNEKDFFLNDILKVGSQSIFSLLTNDNKKYIISGFTFLPFENAPLENKILFLNSIKLLNYSFLENSYKLLPFNYVNNATKNITNVSMTGFFKINGVHEAFNFFDANESDILNNDKTIINIESFTNSSKNKLINNQYFKNLLQLLIVLIILEITYFLFTKKA